jgi:hypothetical protein
MAKLLPQSGDTQNGMTATDYIEIWVTSTSNGDVVTLQDISMFGLGL